MEKFLTGYEDAKVRDRHSRDTGFATVGDSLTVQADSRDADINVIMDRYARTGQIPGLSRLPSYGDFDGISDYREAIHAVREAEDLFMRLPAKVRSKFDNDPQLFVEYCEDPANRLELARDGLLAPEVRDAVLKEAEAVKENPTGGQANRGSVGTAGRDAPAGSRSGSAEGG